MAVLYFYIPAQKLEDVIDCGLKLSEWKDRNQAMPGGDVKPCIRAFLHPMDDKRHADPTLRCIKLDIPVEYCMVGDNDLYQLGLEYPEIQKTYIDSMFPLDKYLFGSFRSPECLVFTTVLSEQISPLGKGLGEPILYENSHTLYVNNLLEQYNSRYDEINQVLLYSFLTMQKHKGCIEGLQSEDKGLAVFYDRQMNHPITVPIPEFNKYS